MRPTWKINLSGFQLASFLPLVHTFPGGMPQRLSNLHPQAELFAAAERAAAETGHCVVGE